MELDIEAELAQVQANSVNKKKGQRGKDKAPRRSEGYQGNKNAVSPEPPKVVVSLSVQGKRRRLVEERLIRQGKSPTEANIRKFVQSLAYGAIEELENGGAIIL